MSASHIHIPTVPLYGPVPPKGERNWVGWSWCLICHTLFRWALRVVAPPPPDQPVHGKANW